MDRFYLKVKDPRNADATIVIPLEGKAFDKDIIRVEYEGKIFETTAEEEKDFTFNVRTLEEKKAKNIASILEKIQICQNQIETFEKVKTHSEPN